LLVVVVAVEKISVLEQVAVAVLEDIELQHLFH
jgi:hypothetical protein